MDAITVENTSPTECLIKCMEEFGECEPEKVLVIYLDKDGWIKHRSSHPMLHHERLGMIEIIKHLLLSQGFTE